MKSVTTAEFIRHFGRYHDEARQAPIALTKHGRPSLVVVSADMFEKLAGSADPLRVFGAGETPPDLAEFLIKGLEQKSAEYRAESDD